MTDEYAANFIGAPGINRTNHHSPKNQNEPSKRRDNSGERVAPAAEMSGTLNRQDAMNKLLDEFLHEGM